LRDIDLANLREMVGGSSNDVGATVNIGRHRLFNFGLGNCMNIVVDRTKFVSDFES
jgi:hypothetical protein